MNSNPINIQIQCLGGGMNIDKLLLKYRLKVIIYNDKNIPNRNLHNNSNCFNTLSTICFLQSSEK